MKASNSLWKEKLAGKLPEDLAREIDIFETDLGLRKQGKIDERLFAETRLAPGSLRPALRQRPAARRQEGAGVRLSLRAY